MKTKFYTICVLLALTLSAPSALYTYGGGAAAIADNNYFGLSESQTLSALGTSISAVTLNFTLAGGFGTDLTGYLRLGSLITSPSYGLSAAVQAYPTISSIPPLSFSIDVTSTFTGLDPNNTWTLFVADTGPGGQTTLNGWSLDITAVPEPVNAALGVFAGVVGVFGLVRYGVKKRRLRTTK